MERVATGVGWDLFPARDARDQGSLLNTLATRHGSRVRNSHKAEAPAGVAGCAIVTLERGDRRHGLLALPAQEVFDGEPFEPARFDEVLEVVEDLAVAYGPQARSSLAGFDADRSLL
jgi:hypothetical protein